jgi:hypothetical protein
MLQHLREFFLILFHVMVDGGVAKSQPGFIGIGSTRLTVNYYTLAHDILPLEIVFFSDWISEKRLRYMTRVLIDSLHRA